MPKCKLCKQPYEKANHSYASLYCPGCKGVVANNRSKANYRKQMRKLGKKVKSAWEERSWVRMEMMVKGYYS